VPPHPCSPISASDGEEQPATVVEYDFSDNLDGGVVNQEVVGLRLELHEQTKKNKLEIKTSLRKPNELKINIT
jgi:hypothetical protein